MCRTCLKIKTSSYNFTGTLIFDKQTKKKHWKQNHCVSV